MPTHITEVHISGRWTVEGLENTEFSVGDTEKPNFQETAKGQIDSPVYTRSYPRIIFAKTHED